MARTCKPGLTYFPLDVEFLNDRKIRKLMRKYGLNAAGVIISVFSFIYKDQGYYMKWDEDICFDLSEQVSLKTAELEAIIKDALNNEIFDKTLYDEYSILTSEAIQKQYRLCTNRRKLFEVDERYWLLPMEINATDNELMQQECTLNRNNVDNLPLFADGMQQSKVKETKGKQKKEKQTPPNLPCKKKGEAEEEREDDFEKKKENEGKKTPPPVPGYCLNKTTHNYTGLLERLAAIGVKDEKEIQNILKMSDYGRIGERVWKIIAYGNWPRGNIIKMPGRYIISTLQKNK